MCCFRLIASPNNPELLCKVKDFFGHHLSYMGKDYNMENVYQVSFWRKIDYNAAVQLVKEMGLEVVEWQ